MPPAASPRRFLHARFVAVAVLVGIGAGIGGAGLVLLLHAVQHLAYGYGPGAGEPAPTFIVGSTAASPLRRLIALSVCGVVAGVGAWALARFGGPVVAIPAAVRPEGPRMPAGKTLLDALLQIVTVGLGAPLGREVAPRQIGAVFAGWLARVAGLTDPEGRVMIACGAGAGLAAVYNVPLGGAVYVLEVLLQSFGPSAAVPALATSVIAARVAWFGIGNEIVYEVPHFETTSSLLVWSIVSGPLFGVAAFAFASLAATARQRAPRGRDAVAWCLAVFIAIGVAAMRYPQILGNGRGPTQLGFDSQLTIGLAAALFVLKLLATVGSLRAGAHGGLLTPSLALGTVMATVLGGLWTLAWPAGSLSPFAIVGAAAFLAVAQKMPVTAIVLVFEFTRVGHDTLFPIAFAVTGAAATNWALRSRLRTP